MLEILQPFEISEDYCGEHDINHPMAGEEPLRGEAVLSLAATSVTSLAATTVGASTVLFIGTTDGHVRKVRTPVC